MKRRGTDSGAAGEWRSSPRGIYCDRRTRHLLVEFLRPRGDERVLSVGNAGDTVADCLKKEGCAVTSWVPRETLSTRALPGGGGRAGAAGTDRFDDLPFSDSEFDVVAVTDCTALFENPERLIREVVRVCRERVFIGAPNRLSLHGAPPDAPGGTSRQGGERKRFFGPGGILRAIRKILPGATVRWGSVLYFPYRWYTACSEMEERMPMNGNPFGSRLGFAFPVLYMFRSLQEPLRDRVMADWKPGAGVWEEVRRDDAAGRDRGGLMKSP